MLLAVSRRCCSFFFFSSRRRHTRLQGDWSSDVCSSDLLADLPAVSAEARARLQDAGLTDVFRLAQLRPEEIGRRAGLDHAAASSVREAARLCTLRGIGTRHAAALAAGGGPPLAGPPPPPPATGSGGAHRRPRPPLPEAR